METSELKTHLQEYVDLRREINKKRLDLLEAEYEVKTQTLEAAMALVGTTNPRTNKPHSWATAEPAAKETQVYHASKRGLAEMGCTIALLEARSRVKWIFLRSLVTDRQLVAFAGEEEPRDV